MHKREVHHRESNHQKHESSHSLDERVLQNLVELQKVHTDLAEKFDKLSTQITQLLNLFEASARAFAKQVNLPGLEKDKEFLDKIDKLLDQNKLIAKGLTLMEDKMKERLYGGNQAPTQQSMGPPPRQMDTPRPLPRF